MINKKGQAINRDEFKVYSTGDLIDGQKNRAGDILNLELMPEWFDAVCIGNHEYAFLGGRDFGTKRKNDRQTTKLLLDRLDEGKLVPSILVNDFLLIHAGLSREFDFKTAEDANAFINAMWDAALDINTPIAIFDWKNNSDYYYVSSDPTSGIFNLGWAKSRNENINQVVGHTIYYTGPIKHEYNNGIVHWNVDTGAKDGNCIGGIIIDDETDIVKPVFWGERKYNNNTTKKLYPLKGEHISSDLYFDPMESHQSSFLALEKWNPGSDKDTTIASSDLKLGLKLIAAWGDIYRVTEIHRGENTVTLKSEVDDTILQKDLNSDWWINFMKYDPSLHNVPLVDLDDVRIGLPHEILKDPEVIGYFREALVL